MNFDKISTRVSDLGKSNDTFGNKYLATIYYEKCKISFVFHANATNNTSKMTLLQALLSDADCYSEYQDIYSMEKMFGSDNINNIFNGCRRQFYRLHRLFTHREIESVRSFVEWYDNCEFNNKEDI